MPVISRPPFFHRVYLFFILPLFWIWVAIQWIIKIEAKNILMPSADTHLDWVHWLWFGVLLMLPIAYFFVIRKLKFVDEVQDVGNALIVRKSDNKARIQFSDIVSVVNRQLPLSVGYYTIIILCAPCRLGREIVFLPKNKPTFFSTIVRLILRLEPPPIDQELLRRIDEARVN